MESLWTRLSAVDTAWLRMDNPRNLMTIVGVWTLATAPDLRALRLRLNQRLLCHPRFRQKVVLDPLGASWVDDDDFDLDHHLVRERLPQGRALSDEAALQARIGALATTRFDPRRPLWQFHLLPYQGGSALIFRLHHCMVDGIALVALLNSLADDAPVLGPTTPLPTADDSHGPLAQWLQPLRSAVAHAVEEPRAVLRQGLQAVRDGVSLATQPDDSPTRLKGPLEGVKLATWHPPLPLPALKAAAHALGGTVNDLLLACVAGALGAWLREQGDDPTGQSIRVMVPVNLRPPEDAWQLGNCFGLAPVLLPIGLPGIAERVAEVHGRMQALKDGFKPQLAYELLQLTGLGPRRGQDLVLRIALDKTTAVMTNVAGPAQPLALCGSTVQRYLFWVPTSRDVGVGASIVSYAGEVAFGLITDRACCAEPQRVMALFTQEVAAARHHAGA
ncbi:MAG: wax ester/triacylglycerol synthase family O-acyltransferase [Burkholderiales bacterium]|nr:wax ester/triacylglycerol synthase family O-acyltransferase [Burkholderiales bacterium]